MNTPVHELSDEELMRLYALGDEAAFNELYKRYAGKIFGFLRRKVNTESDQREIFQDTFLRLHKYRRRYDPLLPFKPWIFTLCQSALIDRMRRANSIVEKPVANISEALPAPAFASPSLLDSNLELLPSRDQAILKLRYYSDLEFHEIASQLEMTPNGVRKALSRALGKLKLFVKRGNGEQ